MNESIESIYRGFRLQDAYCLHRIISAPSTPDNVFQPEGMEDLLVTSSAGQVLEAVQVKGRSQNLVLSMLDPRNPEKFFARMATARRTSPDLGIRLVSFGPVGPSLIRAFKGAEPEYTNAARAIAESKVVTLEEAKDLLRCITIETQDEEKLTEALLEQIRQLRVGIDPEHALSLLESWVRRCAEKRIPITRSDLASRLDAIGRFLSERQAHHVVWDRLVRPIEAKELTPEKTAALQERFYDGASATYQHIVAGLDVPREALIQQVHNGFEKANIAIIRGASGQGKSTLAYRYLHEYGLGHLRYEVQSTQRPEEARDIALAVSGHARAIGIPLMLYMDVRPLDYAWRDLVLLLSEIENVRILVTIREEDWKRGALAQYEIAHQSIEVVLTESDAREIYAAFDVRTPMVTTVGFEDAWIRFGRGRALLEFSYFIRKNESLQERLYNQVERLETEVVEGKLNPAVLELLRLVSVATAYEARINVLALSKHLNLPALSAVLKRFEGEHLIRVEEEGRYISGLHPIRSTILSERLTDKVLHPWQKSAAICLMLMEESDIANFLLYAFSRRGDQTKDLLDAVKGLPVNTWEGALGIVRALLWLGVAQYVQENGNLLDEVYKTAPSTFWLILNFDVSHAMGGDHSVHGFLNQHIDPYWQKKFEDFRSRQTDDSHVFIPLAEWFNTYSILLSPPNSVEAWKAYAEITFWYGRSGANSQLVSSIPTGDLIHSIDSLSLETVGLLISSLSVGRPEAAEKILSETRLALLERFQHETDTIRLHDDGKTITCNFIVPFVAQRQTLERSGAKTFGEMNKQAMWRVNLLRLLFPDREKYYTQGYGHRFLTPLDETEKRIEKPILPFELFTSLNAQFIELATRRYRPDDWVEFAEGIMELRKEIVDQMLDLKRKLRAYSSKVEIKQLWGDGSSNKYINSRAWDSCKSLLEHPIALPKTAGDEWGFVRLGSPGASRKIAQAQAKSSTSASPQSWAYQSAALYVDFANCYRDYTSNWNVFFERAPEVLKIAPLIARRTGSESDRQKAIEQRKRSNAHFASLNALNKAVRYQQVFQREFRNLLGQRIDQKRLAALEEVENSAYNNLWELWYLFALYPGKVYRDPVKSSSDLVGRVLNETYEELSAKLHVSFEGIATASIHQDGPQWNGQPALWVIVDGEDIEKEADHVELAALALIRMLPTDEERFLRYYVYEEFWEHLVIVPLTHGRSQHLQCWTFSMSGHAIDPGEYEFTHSEKQQKAIPLDAVEHFGITEWESPLLQSCNEIDQVSAGLWLYAKHLSEIVTVKDIDEVGAKVVSDYALAISSDIQERFDRLSSCTTQITEWFKTDSFQNLAQQYPHAIGAMAEFGTLADLLPPRAEDNAGSQTMTADQVVDWEQRLVAARRITNAMRESCIRDAVERSLAK